MSITIDPITGLLQYIKEASPYHASILGVETEYLASDSASVRMTGHLKITDDLGEVLVDKYNAIHPQNLSRVFSRSLSNEANSFINRIAFGNGGVIEDATTNITYRSPNNGQSPDTATWESRLYNEIYSEIVNAGLSVLNPLLGTDPGSADANTGIRPGGGAVPTSDPQTTLHVSGPGVRSIEIGTSSQVEVTSVLSTAEPIDWAAGGGVIENFTFNEIGLYTGGSQAISTSGYTQVDVGNRSTSAITGLVAGTTYHLTLSVSGGTPVLITFTTPISGGSGAGGAFTYGDLCDALNTGDPEWGMPGSCPLPGGSRVFITDDSNGLYQTTENKGTFGYLHFECGLVGPTSFITCLLYTI